MEREPGGAWDVGKSRLTREDWVTVARKALVASGIDDVKVDVLARRMKVTRGSFYWHFKDRQELLDAVLEDWATRNRSEIAATRAREESGAGAMEMFFIWLGEDPNFPSFDIAIRVWARKSRRVAELVREIDDAWVALLQRMFEQGGMTAPESFVRARIMYFHQVGYYALSIEESLDERARLAPYYYAALTGTPAPEGMTESLMALKPAKTSRPRAAKAAATSASDASSTD